MTIDRPTPPERLMTDREVAELFGVSRTHVRRLRYSGDLPTVRVGKLARIPASAVAAYLVAHTEVRVAD